MSLLGLDVGTTGSKATLFSDEGEVIAHAYHEHTIENPDSGRYELNPVEVWDAVKAVIKQACEGKGRDLKAVCVSSLGEAFVCMDKNGRELGNSAIYMDERGEAECRELRDRLGASVIYQKTGHEPHQMYSACKLAWIRKNDAGILDKTKSLHFYGDYILHKLGGAHVTDYSLAARSMMFDISNKNWDSDILQAVQIDAEILPDAAATGTVVGHVSEDIAFQLGINRNAKLVLGAHDQIMCAVGAGAVEPGAAANSIGTVDCITPVYGKPKMTGQMAEAGYNCIPYIFDGTYVTYAFNMAGGSLLKWFRDNIARGEKEKAEKDGRGIYDVLNKSMPGQPTDIFVLPHFAGSPSPNADPYAKGAIINLSFSTKREDIYKACMEGEAFEMKKNITALKENGIEISCLRTVGGGSASEEFMQIRADIFQMPVKTMECSEAGALGTAIVAGAATGVYKDILQACRQLTKVKKVFEPSAKNSAYYEARFEKYLKIYDLIKEIR